ncbi:MAG: hypothetical protein V7K48_21270 [Nostoc sp.]|uniref:hypothetical protein n=1 Tax=Nostoc sp. TaxID=1180 RepID=UPI002FF8696E
MKFLTALPVTDSTTVSYRFEGHWGLGGDEAASKRLFFFIPHAQCPFNFGFALASQTLHTAANATLKDALQKLSSVF